MGASNSKLLSKAQEDLTKKEFSQDHEYWEQFWKCAPARQGKFLADPAILSKIARKQPKNFIAGFQEALSKLETLVNTDELSELDANKASFILILLNAGVIIVIENGSRLFKDYSVISKLWELVRVGIKNQNVFRAISESLVRSELWLLNLPYFTRFADEKIELPGNRVALSGLDFILFTSGLLGYGYSENVLFRMSVSVIARHGELFFDAISELSFQPIAELAQRVDLDNYVITFLFLFALNNPNMIEYLVDTGASNRLLFSLLNFALVKLDSSGLNYIHTLIVSLIHIFVMNTKVVSALNEKCERVFDSALKAQPGTYGDVLIEALFHLCNSERLLPAFTSIVQALSLGLSKISIFCAMRLIDVMQILVQQSPTESNLRLAEKLLEAVANMVQRSDVSRTLHIVLSQRTAQFLAMKNFSYKFNESLSIINKFLMAVRTEILKRKTPTVSLTETAEAITSIDLANLFPEIAKFCPEEFNFAVSVAPSWNEWCELLFTQVMKDELDLVNKK